MYMSDIQGSMKRAMRQPQIKMVFMTCMKESQDQFLMRKLNSVLVVIATDFDVDKAFHLMS